MKTAMKSQGVILESWKSSRLARLLRQLSPDYYALRLPIVAVLGLLPLVVADLLNVKGLFLDLIAVAAGLLMITVTLLVIIAQEAPDQSSSLSSFTPAERRGLAAQQRKRHQTP